MAENKEKRYVSDNAQLMAEWDWDKNNKLGYDPAKITLGSNKKTWWHCLMGHSYDATPNNRSHGKGCPYCSGRRVLPGVNDLLTKNPSLADEWNYEKNFPIRPDQVFPGQNNAVWWICKKCGHVWNASINSRNRGAGCPKCAKRYHSSFPEQAIFYYIKQAFPDAINSFRDIFSNSMELDIYIPSRKIGIEYDGERAHTEDTLGKDARKYQICKDNQIRLIRVRERSYSGDCPICDLQIKSIYKSGALETIDLIIEQLSIILNFSVDYNTQRDNIAILEQIKQALDSRSLAVEYPKIASEWNYERNGNLTPEMFFPGNGDKVWWRCSKGHEWKASIQPRTKLSVGCPYCSNKQVLQGFNDLATTDPVIALEWDSKKNKDLTPHNVTRSSRKKAWWICQSGHEYPMRISHRTAGHKCPYCTGRVAISGVNDFTLHSPSLLEEWDYEKNIGISPTDYLPGSEKKVWWVCKKCGHSWDAIIANRVKGSGCPECGKKLANLHALESKIQNSGSFEKWCYEHPDKQYLLAEWDSSNQFKPSEVSPKSYKKILWKCGTCGYSWVSEVFRRANAAKTCPVCLNRVALPGFNDLATKRPDLLNEWCYELNRNISPQQVTVGSSKIVWWRGNCGHTWESKVSDRGVSNYGCPYCSGVRILAGFNDLLTCNPCLAAEWDYQLNNFLPSEVTPNSHKKAHWICKICGHKWEAQIKSRNTGVGCPECAKQKRKKSK